MASERNAEILADALCRMRGAALKIGQMLSIQDESVVPGPLAKALARARSGADVMPRRQLEETLARELGPDWEASFASFDRDPVAAASIGQVHKATRRVAAPAGGAGGGDGSGGPEEGSSLPEESSSAESSSSSASAAASRGELVALAVKVQYPGVAESVESDVDNLLRLAWASRLLPRGLYLENMARVAKAELRAECDYALELEAQRVFRRLVDGDEALRGAVRVPGVVPELSTSRVLTTEWAPGRPIDAAADLDQATRDAVGAAILRLTLTELFVWGRMQTDPNWGNFLYDDDSRALWLLDFGAARSFEAGFVADYVEMVAACAAGDRDEIVARSVALGFLTGDESGEMLDAHVETAVAVGLPFARPGPYDFARHGEVTGRVADLARVMLRHRLTPPPDASYSLHRKLSGAFLVCMKLRATVDAKALFDEARARFHADRDAGVPWPAEA